MNFYPYQYTYPNSYPHPYLYPSSYPYQYSIFIPLIPNVARHRLMEIDSHILGLSMEFEKQNIIITEWETERAKTKSDHIYQVKYFFGN